MFTAPNEAAGILDGSLNPNYSPLYGLENLTPKLDLITLTEGELSWDGFRIVSRELPHGHVVSLGFRIEADGGTLACIPDVEYAEGDPSDGAMDVASDADVLVHDALSSALDVMKRRGGPGGKRPDDAVWLAREAGVKRLYLTHHDPDRTDESMEEMLARLRLSAPDLAIEAAREGEVLELGRTR